MQKLDRLPAAALRKVRVLAADIDDTVTAHGRFPPGTLAAFTTLETLGIAVVLVTGRSAGWAQALAAYLPGVRLVIGENGLIMFDGGGRRWDLGRDITESVTPAVLREGADRLCRELGLAYTGDDPFRLFERALERSPAFDARAQERAAALVGPACEVIASSIHVHVRPKGWGKAEGLRAALRIIGLGPDVLADDEILFVGDSANDRSLFRAFPATSVGVKNVTRFIAELGPDVPRYITEGEAAAGFAELVQRVVSARASHMVDNGSA